MEMEYCPDLSIDVEYNLPYRANGDIKSIIKGTKKALLDKTKEKTGEIFEAQEQKNISLNAIRRIAERIFSDERLFSDILLLSLEIQFKTNISDEAKEFLINNKKMLFSLANVLENIIKFENYDFKIEGIDISYDPEIPEWKPLEINLKINSDDFNERLKIKHQIVEKAFKEIDEEARKKIFIIGAI
ncbi:MAG: hypothetical protein ACTSV5_11060 [Promethearchaeota archaeon]